MKDLYNYRGRIVLGFSLANIDRGRLHRYSRIVFHLGPWPIWDFRGKYISQALLSYRKLFPCLKSVPAQTSRCQYRSSSQCSRCLSLLRTICIFMMTARHVFLGHTEYQNDQNNCFLTTERLSSHFRIHVCKSFVQAVSYISHRVNFPDTPFKSATTLITMHTVELLLPVGLLIAML